MDNLENALKSFDNRYRSLSVDSNKNDILKITYNQLVDDYNLSSDEKIKFADLISKKYSLDGSELFRESIDMLKAKIEALTTMKELLSKGYSLSEAKTTTKKLMIAEGWNKNHIRGI